VGNFSDHLWGVSGDQRQRLVGWKAARSMTAALVVDALNMAAWTRRHTTLDGLICHTDAGSQLGFKES
jgi:transposase InsO family protein